MAATPELANIDTSWGDKSPAVAGGIAGFFAGSMFGAMMSATSMMENVAALVGLENPAVGWVVHFSISILVAMLYVVIVSDNWLARYANRPSTGAGLGIAYGIILWTSGVVFVMPLWLGVVTPATPPVPNLNWMSFVGHLIYGVFLGALYPILLDHGQPSLGLPSDESVAEADSKPRAFETRAGSGSTTNVFSVVSIRTRLENDEIPLALVLASTAIERILLETIADEADIATDHVGEFCRGEDLDSYVHTASVLGLFDERIDLLREVKEHRNTMVRQTPREFPETVERDSEERRLILDAITFIEDVDG